MGKMPIVAIPQTSLFRPVGRPRHVAALAPQKVGRGTIFAMAIPTAISIEPSEVVWQPWRTEGRGKAVTGEHVMDIYIYYIYIYIISIQKKMLKPGQDLEVLRKLVIFKGDTLPLWL